MKNNMLKTMENLKIDEEFVKKYDKEKTNFCWECGHWFNGYKKYSGTLIPYPFKPKY